MPIPPLRQSRALLNLHGFSFRGWLRTPLTPLFPMAIDNLLITTISGESHLL